MNIIILYIKLYIVKIKDILGIHRRPIRRVDSNNWPDPIIF